MPSFPVSGSSPFVRIWIQWRQHQPMSGRDLPFPFHAILWAWKRSENRSLRIIPLNMGTPEEMSAQGYLDLFWYRCSRMAGIDDASGKVSFSSTHIFLLVAEGLTTGTLTESQELWMNPLHFLCFPPFCSWVAESEAEEERSPLLQLKNFCLEYRKRFLPSYRERNVFRLNPP